MESKLEAHLSHPFYIKAKEEWEAVRQGQIRKGSVKYPEPFTPANWTNDQLAEHAIQENVDQLHYIVGMKQRMEYQHNYILLLQENIKNMQTQSGTTYEVLKDIELERVRQNSLWGNQSHDIGTWLAILGEEFGEVCQAIQSYLGLVSVKETDSSNLYEELIHHAAVTTKMAEQVKELSEKNAI